jgi:hypothetical protein
MADSIFSSIRSDGTKISQLIIFCYPIDNKTKLPRASDVVTAMFDLC